MTTTTLTHRTVTAADLAHLELPTPIMVLDLEQVRRNLRKLAAYLAKHKLNLRPHTKTHKQIALAKMQMEIGGAYGLTVAKVGELEVMARAGDDLLLAYPAVDAARTRRLVEVARHKTVRVAVDSTVAIDAIADAARQAGVTVGILVDQDVGLRRTGVQTAEQTVALARHVRKHPCLRLDGLFTYPGHIFAPLDDMPPLLKQVAHAVAATLELWKKNGLEAAIVSGGSTPTAYMSHHIPLVTEIRPGTYIFNDMNEAMAGYCTLEECAARIIATVVSDAVPGQVVVDAGNKTLCMDRCIPKLDLGHGGVVECPEATVPRLTEEHGIIDVSKCPRKPRIGDRVTIIPNHICPAVNLQSQVWWWDAGKLECNPVDARGLLS